MWSLIDLKRSEQKKHSFFSISAKTTIVASILQGKKEEKDGVFKAGGFTVCEQPALIQYLKLTNNTNVLNRHLVRESNISIETGGRCDFQIPDAHNVQRLA